MNVVREINRINEREIALGQQGASWHDQYKDSAYVFVGGLPFELTEGDVITIFSQYGEIMDINMPRDKETGKPRGFSFLMYEDQRSTILAVDNMNGAKVLERTLRVDHVAAYKQPKEKGEDGEWIEPEEQSLNAAPKVVNGSPTSSRSGSPPSDADSIDPDDPMASYLLQQRKERKAKSSTSKGDKKPKRTREEKEARRARKAEKKRRKEEKELRRHAGSSRYQEEDGGRTLGRSREPDERDVGRRDRGRDDEYDRRDRDVRSSRVDDRSIRTDERRDRGGSYRPRSRSRSPVRSYGRPSYSRSRSPPPRPIRSPTQRRPAYEDRDQTPPSRRYRDFSRERARDLRRDDGEDEVERRRERR